MVAEVIGDLDSTKSVVKDIKKVSKGKKIIVTKSTVPVGTGDQIERILGIFCFADC